MKGEDAVLYKSLGELIAKKRKDKGLRQLDLADKVGISRGTAAALEAGVIRIDFYRLKKICAVLGINIGEL